MWLSVIIPAYNEESRLPKTLKSVHEYLKAQPYESEILVVSDGSTDRTVEVAKGMNIQNLRVLDSKENHGKGYAVRQGMLAAAGEFRLFMDADNSTTIDHVERMWPEFEAGYAVVICSRDLKESVIPIPQSWWRRRLGDTFNLMVQTLSGLWGMWDTQCGFKGFSETAAVEIFSRSKIDRWAFDVEALVIAKTLGFKMKEIPVTWNNDPNSKVKLSGMIRMLLEVVQIRKNSIRGLYEAR